MKVKNWFFGFLVQPRENWRSVTPEPQPPKNYTNPDKIAEWKDNRWTQLAAESASKPFLGRVVDFAVIDASGAVVVADTDPASAYAKLVDSVRSVGNDAAAEPIRLWGVQIRTRIHQLAVNAFEAGYEGATWGLFADTHTSRPAALEAMRMLDPVRLIMGGSSDEQAAVCRQLIDDNPTIWTSAKQIAEFVRDLTTKFHLDGPTV